MGTGSTSRKEFLCTVAHMGYKDRMRMKSEVATRREAQAKALAAVRHNVATKGVKAVAEALIVSPATIQNWIDGDTVPTYFMALRVLEKVRPA